MSGRNKFRELARPIDENPERQERVEALGRANEVLLDLAASCASERELALLERQAEEMTTEELLKLGKK